MIQVLTTTDQWTNRWHSVHRWDNTYRNHPKVKEIKRVRVRA